eukprot:PhM_4_TR13732/c0_g1_i1/m.58549/K05543/DUS2; tRNA-dihydrouridine synthase 2
MFKDKVIVAPMVRISTLGFRELCGHYDADVCFSEELVAFKLAKCTREVNTTKGVVEYVALEPTGKPKNRQLKRSVIFSTKIGHGERAKVVLQLGAPNPEIAVAAATMVVDDVDGIDLNMGCPKKFSVEQKMGAALMSAPDTACSILRALVAAVGRKVPVSVKTRLMDDDEKALELLSRLAETGVHAITLHARTRDQRSTTPAVYTRVRPLFDALHARYPNVALVINGDVAAGSREEMERLREITGCDGIMLARAAMHNPSVLSKDATRRLSLVDAQREVVRWHLRYSACFANIKYQVTRSLPDIDARAQMHAATTWEGMCDSVGLSREELAQLLATYEDPLALITAPESYNYPTPSGSSKKQVRDDDEAAAATSAAEQQGCCEEEAKRRKTE